MYRSEFSNPFAILAIGVAAALGLWGLAQVLPALGEFFGILIQSFLAGAGLAVAAATTGFATAGAISAWVPKVAAASLVAAGVSTTYLVVAKVVEKGKEKPYEWLLPALGLLAVFFVDLTKDQLVQTVTERAIYALFTGLLTVGGGFLLMQQRIVVRAIGFILPFVPSVVVWLLLVQNKHVTGALSDFIAAGTVGAIGLVGVFAFGSLVALLGVLLPNRERP